MADRIVIAAEPQVVAQSIKRKKPGNWRPVPNPLTEQLRSWQVAAAALRYAPTHEYNIIVAGTIDGSPVYLDSYLESKYFFYKNCILFLSLVPHSECNIKFFKCLGHAKGEGADLLYFAMKYLAITEPTDTKVTLEPDYSMSEPGQFQGSNEERNRKLVAYYTKLGFTPVDGTAKPAMENTIATLIERLDKLQSKTVGGRTRRRTRRHRRNHQKN